MDAPITQALNGGGPLVQAQALPEAAKVTVAA